MNKVWFASDHHFFHKRIQEFCPTTRRGESVEEMNELIIQAHNSCVGYADHVYFLGDFSFGTDEQTLMALRRLNGLKHLVYGNHDKVIKNNKEIQSLFASIQDYKRLSVEKQTVILFHFPIREWESCHHGSFHLYGHVHGGLPGIGRSMDVGLDARDDNSMRPWSWDEIHSKLSKMPIIEHH